MRRSLAFALVLAACGTKPEESAPTSPSTGLLPPERGIQLEMRSTLASGVETERCQFFVAPPEGLWVTKSEAAYTPGSHHVLLFHTPYEAIPDQTNDGREIDPNRVFECPEGAAADFDIDQVIAGAQRADAPPLVMPEGVAIH